MLHFARLCVHHHIAYLACSVPIILVGNKSDLHMQRWACVFLVCACWGALVHHVSQHSRVVTQEMGRKLASDYHVPFLESSAKQNEVRGLAHWDGV